MSTLRESGEQLHGSLEALLENQLAYYKLWSFRAGMKSLVLLIRLALFTLLGILALLFLSIAAALVIGNALNSTAHGFLITGSFYLLLLTVAYLLRERINRPILRRFSEIFFTDVS